MNRQHLLLACLPLWIACAGAPLPPTNAPPPLTEDPDRRPFAPQPESYTSPLVWDGVDKTVFRPIVRVFAVDPAGEAANANALDEVADSSWFTNRMGRAYLSAEEAASGPCTTPPLDASQPWTISSGKSEGAAWGLWVKSEGRSYLVKFDNPAQGPQTTAADVIGSRFYYAAGFGAPCNRVVFFDRATLRLDPGARVTTWTGVKEPFTPAYLDIVLSHGGRTRDGRYRASSSLRLDGKAIGAWRFDGTRSDDLNDVVDHEDRRELRGARLLAAWLGHTDSREENTLATWMPAGHDTGWVRHSFIDFSDCFGSVWDPPSLGRRQGNEYLVEFPDMFESFVTLGIPHPSWEKARFGPGGRVLGYFEADRFDPEGWRPNYRVSAFERMTERDGAWMARIIAHFSDEHIRRLVRSGRLGSEELNELLSVTLAGRRDKILRRYLVPLSALGDPELTEETGTSELCLRDLATFSGIRGSRPGRYSAKLEAPSTGTASTPVAVRMRGRDDVCVALPRRRGRPQAEPWHIAIESSEPGEGRLLASVSEREGASVLAGLSRFPPQE